MSDDLFALSGNEFVEQFGRVLKSSGRIHREARADVDKKHNDPSYNEHLHRKPVRDGSRGVMGGVSDGIQERIHRASENAVQKMREWKLMHVELLIQI